MPRTFDPPLPYAEVGKVYDFTTRLFARLGMPAWRYAVREKPAPPDCFATVEAQENKHVGYLSLAADWMTLDSDQKAETLLHETLHLAHRDLTDLLDDDVHDAVGRLAYKQIHARWNRSVELMVDHLTQVLIGEIPDLKTWAAEIWPDEPDPDE